MCMYTWTFLDFFNLHKHINVCIQKTLFSTLLSVNSSKHNQSHVSSLRIWQSDLSFSRQCVTVLENTLWLRMPRLHKLGAAIKEHPITVWPTEKTWVIWRTTEQQWDEIRASCSLTLSDYFPRESFITPDHLLWSVYEPHLLSWLFIGSDV